MVNSSTVCSECHKANFVLHTHSDKLKKIALVSCWQSSTAVIVVTAEGPSRWLDPAVTDRWCELQFILARVLKKSVSSENGLILTFHKIKSFFSEGMNLATKS